YGSNKSWSSVEDLRPHLDPIVRHLGRMPNSAELAEQGRADLQGAIRKFGGFSDVASSLGYSHVARKQWKTVEDLRDFLDPLVIEYGRMPTKRELRVRGREDLNGAIVKFGGHPRVARALGYPHQGRKSWTSVEQLRSYLDPLVRDLDRMPTHDEFREFWG